MAGIFEAHGSSTRESQIAQHLREWAHDRGFDVVSEAADPGLRLFSAGLIIPVKAMQEDARATFKNARELGLFDRTQSFVSPDNEKIEDQNKKISLAVETNEIDRAIPRRKGVFFSVYEKSLTKEGYLELNHLGLNYSAMTIPLKEFYNAFVINSICGIVSHRLTKTVKKHGFSEGANPLNFIGAVLIAQATEGEHCTEFFFGNEVYHARELPLGSVRSTQEKNYGLGIEVWLKYPLRWISTDSYASHSWLCMCDDRCHAEHRFSGKCHSIRCLGLPRILFRCLTMLRIFLFLHVDVLRTCKRYPSGFIISYDYRLLLLSPKQRRRLIGELRPLAFVRSTI